MAVRAFNIDFIRTKGKEGIEIPSSSWMGGEGAQTYGKGGVFLLNCLIDKRGKGGGEEIHFPSGWGEELRDLRKGKLQHYTALTPKLSSYIRKKKKERRKEVLPLRFRTQRGGARLEKRRTTLNLLPRARRKGKKGEKRGRNRRHLPLRPNYKREKKTKAKKTYRIPISTANSSYREKKKEKFFSAFPHQEKKRNAKEKASRPMQRHRRVEHLIHTFW